MSRQADAVVLAAGEGARFGGPKQVTSLDGRPLLEHVLATITRCCGRVVVVLGAHRDVVLSQVNLHGARPVACENWAEGTFASLCCGLAALPNEGQPVLVALGDQPTLSLERIAAVLATPGAIVRAADAGRPSHPVVIRSREGLSPRALTEARAVELGPLPDVDTPAHLAAVTRRRGN
jgi:CTP:molybdopterin cytidylyltransferase MocA